MGQTLGRDTVLECVIVSSPQALYYWEKERRQIFWGTSRIGESSLEGRSSAEWNGR